MKHKQWLALLLSAGLCLSMASGCSQTSTTPASSAPASTAEQSKPADQSFAEASDVSSTTSEPSTPAETLSKTLVIKDLGKSASMKATFVNSSSGQSEDVSMEKTGEGEGYFLFSCAMDPDKYNLVHVSNGEDTTKDVAFNVCISGWKLDAGELLPCVPSAEKDFELKFTTESFEFNGHQQDVYIWTPDDYDKDSSVPYSTIYMLDGQTVLTTEFEFTTELRSWNVAQHANALMNATDNKAILVCINTMMDRDSELTPKLSESVLPHNTKYPKADLFADFLCNTLMPYVQEKYNVYKDAQHTALAGSSIAGMGTLYLAMEHPDKIGTAGVLSPSTWVYDEEEWKTYFASKTFGDESALLYFYSGSYGNDTGYCAEPTYNDLIDAGYPKDKLIFSKLEEGRHDPEHWSNIYPEFLEAVFYQKVAGLPFGEKITYEDRTPPENLELIKKTSEEESHEPDTRPDYIKNYVFFDNSETKWEKVYAYWWPTTEEVPRNKVTEQVYMADWPGFQMEQIEGTDIYRVVSPIYSKVIIFSNGILDSEVAEGVTAYQTDNLVYDDYTFSGKIYKIDTSVPPKHGTGVEKTKYHYSKGEWRDYTD